MSFRHKLFDRVKRGPEAIQGPLRAAWNGYKRFRDFARPLVVIPRAFTRWSAKKRVLGIHHFQEQAAFLGDMMEFLVILNVLRVENGLDKVDLCYIDDPSNPNHSVSRGRLESSPDFKEMMLALRALLPSAGAVFHFDSDIEFETFFRRHYHRYVRWPRYGYFHSWPSRLDYHTLTRSGAPFPNTYLPLERFFAGNGYLPRISCPPEALSWASAFVRRHAAPAMPVAAQIRFNPESPYRNTDLEAWKGFFGRMQAHTNVKFIVLCRREEIVPELRAFRNVIYAKDHGSSVLQDLALIQVSHFSMFPDSGFCTFPWFCGLPTIYFGKQKLDFAQARMGDAEGNGLRFLTPHQRRKWGECPAEFIEAEFWSLWNDLASTGWTNPHLADQGSDSPAG